MGPGRKPKDLADTRPVQVSWQLTITGGHQKTPTVVETDKAEHEGREITFVSVSAVTPWLCEMVAGQCASKRPLARCSIIGQLRKLMLQDAPQLPATSRDDKMAALFDADDEPEKEATPQSQEASRSGSRGLR